MRFSKLTYPECPVIFTKTLWGGNFATPEGNKRIEVRRAVYGGPDKFLYVWIEGKGLYAVDIFSVIEDIFQLDDTPDNDPTEEFEQLTKTLNSIKGRKEDQDEDHAVHGFKKRG